METSGDDGQDVPDQAEDTSHTEVSTPFTGATDDYFELAHAALLEISDPASIGDRAGSIDEGDGVVTVYFDVTLPGYHGWRWTASIAHVDELEPSVLETEMMPGDGAVLAPEWVPWVDRLADYRSAQDADAAASASGPSDEDSAVDDEDYSEDDDSDDEPDSDDESDDEDEPDDEDESDDEDEPDDDEDDDTDSRLGSLLHAGDLDGVDIDDLDESADDDDEATEDDEPDDETVQDDETAQDDGADEDDEESASVTADGVDEAEDAEQQSDGAGDQPLRVPPVDERSGDQ